MPNDTNQVRQILNDPGFYLLDPSERVKVLGRLDSNFAVLPADEQLRVVSRGVQQSQAPAAQSGAFQTHKGSPIYNARTGNMPEDSDLPPALSIKGVVRKLIPPLALGDALHSGARTLEANSDGADYDRQQALANGQPNPRSWLAQGANDVGAATLRTAAGTQSPTNLGIAAGTAAMPEVALPLLAAGGIAHGGYKTASGAYGLATKGATPEKVGDTLGGTGELLGSVALVKPAVSAVSDTLTPPTLRATNLYQRAVAPGGTTAEGQLESRETFDRAAPYLAEQERATPVLNKQPADSPFAGQKMGVMNYRQNAQGAAKSLWEKIEPRAQMYSTAPLEPTKAGLTAADAIRSTTNPTEAQLNPGKVAGVQDLATFYDKPMSVGEALDRISELNSDKGVQAYEQSLPDKQAELLKGDPTIEGKITAANTLRDQVFDSIETHGTPEDANWIRGARSDYGAITEVGKSLGNAQVPTPQPVLSRLGNSLRLSLSPTFAREYLAKPVETLFDFNNPNRLAMKSSQALGRSDLQPPPPPPIRLTPWNPNARPNGPIVGAAGQTATFTGGSGGPMFTPPQTPFPPTGPGNNVALFPDIPSGHAPSTEHAAGEVPNWPPKVMDWSSPNNAPPIPSAKSAVPTPSPWDPTYDGNCPGNTVQYCTL
jgi:hypothetical protein